MDSNFGNCRHRNTDLSRKILSVGKALTQRKLRNFIIEDSDDEFDEGAITTLPKDYEQKMKAEQKRKKAIEHNYEVAKRFHGDNDVVPRLTRKIIEDVNNAD